MYQQLQGSVLPEVTQCESLPIWPREKLTHKPTGLAHTVINRGSFKDLEDVHLTVNCTPTTTSDYLFICCDHIWWDQDS